MNDPTQRHAENRCSERIRLSIALAVHPLASPLVHLTNPRAEAPAGRRPARLSTSPDVRGTIALFCAILGHRRSWLLYTAPWPAPLNRTIFGNKAHLVFALEKAPSDAASRHRCGVSSPPPIDYFSAHRPALGASEGKRGERGAIRGRLGIKFGLNERGPELVAMYRCLAATPP